MRSRCREAGCRARVRGAAAFPPSVGASCSLGNGSADTVCSWSNSRHANLIETAINLLVQERPQIFDLKDVSAPNSDFYKVLDTEAYLDGLVTNLRRQGACAERDTDDAEFRRILVKTSNQFSETYEVLTPNGYVRRAAEQGRPGAKSGAVSVVQRTSSDLRLNEQS